MLSKNKIGGYLGHIFQVEAGVGGKLLEPMLSKGS